MVQYTAIVHCIVQELTGKSIMGDRLGASTLRQEPTGENATRVPRLDGGKLRVSPGKEPLEHRKGAHGYS